MKKLAITLCCSLLLPFFCFGRYYDDDDNYSNYDYDSYDDELPYYLDDFDTKKYLVSERLSDVFGQDDVKSEAIKIIDLIKNSSTYRGLGARIPNVITIRGNKGTGRTLLAKAIAGESNACWLLADSAPCISVCRQLAQQFPIVVFAGDCSDHELHTYIDYIEEHKPSCSDHHIVIIRIKNLIDPSRDDKCFCFWDLDDDEQDKDEDRILEETIYVHPLDKAARCGLLKKFAREVRVKKSLLRDSTFEQLSAKTSNFNAFQLKDLVNKAAIFAGQDYSLHGEPAYNVDKKHFYQAYYEVAKEAQSGKGGGSFFVESFYYTYAEDTRFSDVIGIDYVVREVKEYIDILVNGDKYAKIGIKPPKGLLLEGLPGVGKTLLARAIAGEAGCCFISVSGPQFISGWLGGGQESVRALFDFANKISPGKHKIIFIDEFDSLGKRPEGCGGVSNEYRNTINEFLKQMDGFEKNEKILVIAATNDADRLDPAILREGRFDRKVYVPLPDETGRRDMLVHYMSQVLCDPRLHVKRFTRKLAKKCKGFNGAGIKTLVNEAAILAIRGDSDVVKKEHFLESYNKISPRIQSGLGGDNDEGFQYTFSEDTRFNNVIGMDEVVDEVKEFLDALLYPERYKKIGISRQKGLILYGPPGTGKTLLARAIAGESGCCFISANAASFIKIYVGSGPAKVRKLFRFARKMAQNKPVIIFFDEVDAFGMRGTDFGGGGERNKTLNQLLSEIDGFSQDENVVIIGATNNINLVDDALLRDGRFDKKIEIPLPSLTARTSILEYYLRKIVLSPDLSLLEIAQKYAAEMRWQSGASLESLVKKAALNAVHHGADYVEENHLEDAFMNTVLGLKADLTQTPEEIKATADHEAGHTLISVLTGHEVTRMSILPRTNSLGVAFRKDKREVFSNNNKEDLMHMIMIMLGGFCAESLLHGQTTPGARNDLEKANELAFDMVHKYGMGDGKLKGVISSCAVSDKTKEMFDDATFDIVHKCMRATEGLLKKYKKKLNTLSKELLKKETLSAEDIYSCVGRPRNVAIPWS